MIDLQIWVFEKTKYIYGAGEAAHLIKSESWAFSLRQFPDFLNAFLKLLYAAQEKERVENSHLYQPGKEYSLEERL